MSSLQIDPPPHRHVTITAGSKRRVLFRVEIRPDGDLLLILRYPRFLAPTEEPTKPVRVVDMHCSVHPTAESKTRINAITAVIKTDDKQEIKRLHYTRAMKHNNFAAHVFALRASHLEHEQFEAVDLQGEIISLGQYNPFHFQLIYQVLVSSQDVPPLYSKGDVNCIQFKASTFLVTVLWSFMSSASTPGGTLLPIETIKPEELDSVQSAGLKEIYEMMPEGFNPTILLEHFVNLRELMKTIYVSKIEKYNPPSKQRDELIQLIETAAFFAKGDESHHKYRRHLRRVARVLRNNSLIFPSPSG
jgi:hypothetical protein